MKKLFILFVMTSCAGFLQANCGGYGYTNNANYNQGQSVQGGYGVKAPNGYGMQNSYAPANNNAFSNYNNVQTRRVDETGPNYWQGSPSMRNVDDSTDNQYQWNKGGRGVTESGMDSNSSSTYGSNVQNRAVGDSALPGPDPYPIGRNQQVDDTSVPLNGNQQMGTNSNTYTPKNLPQPNSNPSN